MNEFIIFFRLMDHYWYKRYVTNIHWLAIIFRKCPLWPIISKDSLTINLKQIKFLKLGKRTKNILLLMSCLTPYHVQLVLKTENVKLSNFAIFSKNRIRNTSEILFISNHRHHHRPHPNHHHHCPHPNHHHHRHCHSNQIRYLGHHCPIHCHCKVVYWYWVYKYKAAGLYFDHQVHNWACWVFWVCE